MNLFLLYSQPLIGGMEKGRPYVYFSHVLSKKKYRYYSGVAFGMRSARGLNPEEVKLYYRSLLKVISVKLIEGWNPEESTLETSRRMTSNCPLREYGVMVLNHIKRSDYGVKHKETLRLYWEQLVHQFGKIPIDNIATSDVQQYLVNRYVSSNTSFNTSKRYIRCIFNLLIQLGVTVNNPVLGIRSKKAKASINEAFEMEELRNLMAFLKDNDQVLYRVALLMFTTFLRPHQEIRLLRARYFDFCDKQLILPPRFTKNGNQVTIPLQQAVIEEFEYVKNLNPNDCIFGMVNVCYFKTRWGKTVKSKYPLRPNQTLYSIRHTAAVQVYKKSKDVALLQRLMCHSSMEVTLGYLRSINCNMPTDNKELYPTIF